MGNVFGSPRMAPVLAVVLGLLALGASLADIPPAIALRQTGPGGPVAFTLITLAVAVPGTAVGVLLAARRPRNPIGWLLLTLLLLGANPADGYAIVDYRMHHGTLPLGWVAVVFLEASRLFRCSRRSCSGCSPTGGCRRAAGGGRLGR